MRNISVFIEGGKSKTFKFKKPIATYGTRLAAKEITVFWNFKNITSAIGNNTIVIKKSENGGTDEEKTINDGYDFQEFKKTLEGHKLELEMNTYDNTCSIDKAIHDVSSKLSFQSFRYLAWHFAIKECTVNLLIASTRSSRNSIIDVVWVHSIALSVPCHCWKEISSESANVPSKYSQIIISWAIFTAMDHAHLGVQITNNHCHEVVIIFVDVCSMHQQLCILMACAYTNRMSPAGTNRHAPFGSEATKF